MAIDIERMLQRVVRDVLGEDTVVEYSRDDYIHRAAITSVDGQTTSLRLRASCEWFDARIDQLDIGAVLFDYGDDESEKEDELRNLALLLRAYVRGEGRVEYRRTRILRRERPNFIANVGGYNWRVGRNTFSIGEAVSG